MDIGETSVFHVRAHTQNNDQGPGWEFASWTYESTDSTHDVAELTDKTAPLQPLTRVLPSCTVRQLGVLLRATPRRAQ
jgi:hypothetical protein